MDPKYHTLPVTTLDPHEALIEVLITFWRDWLSYWAWLQVSIEAVENLSSFLIFLEKGIDCLLSFGNINNADGDRRVTNCRRERGGSRGKSAQVEKRSRGPAQTQFATHRG